MASEEKRPWTVTAFESLALVLLAAELVLSEGFSIGDLVWAALDLWLILSISRKKGALARTIYTALCLTGWVLLVAVFSGQFGQVPSYNLVEWLAEISFSAATVFLLWLLWSAPTSMWLTTRHRAGTRPVSYDR